MRFVLTAPHLIGDVVHPAGTEVGSGTVVDFTEPALDGKNRKWRLPSMFMDPIDDEARDAIIRHNKRMADKGARPELPAPPLVARPGEAIPGQGPGAPLIPRPPQTFREASQQPAYAPADTPTPAYPAALPEGTKTGAVAPIGVDRPYLSEGPIQPAEVLTPEEEKAVKERAKEEEKAKVKNDAGKPTIEKTLPKP